jgi:hypothetical protein
MVCSQLLIRDVRVARENYERIKVKTAEFSGSNKEKRSTDREFRSPKITCQ